MFWALNFVKIGRKICIPMQCYKFTKYQNYEQVNHNSRMRGGRWRLWTEVRLHYKMNVSWLKETGAEIIWQRSSKETAKHKRKWCAPALRNHCYISVNFAIRDMISITFYFQFPDFKNFRNKNKNYYPVPFLSLQFIHSLPKPVHERFLLLL